MCIVCSLSGSLRQLLWAFRCLQIFVVMFLSNITVMCCFFGRVCSGVCMGVVDLSSGWKISTYVLVSDGKELCSSVSGVMPFYVLVLGEKQYC